MPEWKSRLAVRYTKLNAQGMPEESVSISPIDTFTPTFALATESLHSIEATHIGAIYSPQAITFSMTVKAIGEVAGKLTKLALDGTLFDVELQEGEGDDWSFSSIVLQKCIITSCMPTSATISGAPSATFSGFSLGAKADAKAEPEVTIP